MFKEHQITKTPIPMLPLDELKPGDKATICLIQGTTVEEAHLMEMGLLPGTAVELIKRAPLGDPIELRVRRYHLSIRRSEAHAILVKILPDPSTINQ